MKNNPVLTASTEFEVQFYDVDSMRVVWHGSYVKFLEIARCELLKKFDYNYLKMEASGYLWPIVDMRLKYVSSAKLGQIIEVEANLIEYESRLKIEYIIRDATSKQVLTKAYTIQVAVDMQNNEMLYQSPAVLTDKIKAVL
ncbi:acyl-CoA thioesterase [Catenovulum sp. 2E275]|uniref:acyl-CoA thioesterase n=1 Tax=Catenovulum sp. 2E275 TaxID=2980497 RepID=UPI0021D330B1|nr:acyl-CoA thioesterase [Catenovulum sp. 2E275]MCU4676654.1 acyl-CoA thioesterase [Catenovulum sp. 2E275]